MDSWFNKRAMPIPKLTEIRSIRSRVKKALKDFTPAQRLELKRYGIDPKTGKGVVVVPGTSAKHIGGENPRIAVGGRGASRSTIVHELSHAYLTSKLPRAKDPWGMGVQHMIMGIAGDVIEGPDSDVSLVPKRLDRAASQFSEAIRLGATNLELKGAAFRGGNVAIGQEKGKAAADTDLRRWKGGGHPPPATIRELTQRIRKPPGPGRVLEITQYGEATTRSRLRFRQKMQLQDRAQLQKEESAR